MAETTNWGRLARRRVPSTGKAHTKIVATIGPASEGRIEELLDAGLSVARINLSHGDDEDVRRRVGLLRQVSAARGVPIGILADIRGPKLRLGVFPGGKIELEEGAEVELAEGDGMAEGRRIQVDFPGLLESSEKGQRVLLADGVVELVVEEKFADHLRARVVRPGPVGDHKGVCLPDSRLTLQVPTEEDRRDLELCRQLDVDFVGVSFVSRAEEILAVRACVPDALIVAKIERVAALENLDELLDATDGIMVARGDLGVEMELEQLPMVQKALIQDALKAGKFTITATEMLESMIHSSRPTRAEVTDVANAVLDGTDAVMLSAETAVGKHPVEAVEAMHRIARAVETSQRYHELPRGGFRASEPTFSNAVALAAAQAAEALGVEHIICFTETGNTPRLLSRYRPHAEVIALSPHLRTLRHMAVLAHVRPIEFPHRPTLEDMLDSASRELVARGLLKSGERVVFVAGVPPAVARSTNVLKLHRIGDPIKLG
ncbi:MAG: pyruvate kinase [Planctomycetota bacterium]